MQRVRIQFLGEVTLTTTTPCECAAIIGGRSCHGLASRRSASRGDLIALSDERTRAFAEPHPRRGRRVDR